LQRPIANVGKRYSCLRLLVLRTGRDRGRHARPARPVDRLVPTNKRRILRRGYNTDLRTDHSGHRDLIGFRRSKGRVFEPASRFLRSADRSLSLDTGGCRP